MSFYRVGDSLLVRVEGTSDEVTVTDYFGTAGLDEIVMPDGTVYTPENVPLESLPQNEFLYSRGDGSITFTVNDPTSSITDVLRLGSNVDPATVRVTADRDGNLVIRFARSDGSFDSNDRVIVTGGVTIAAARLDQIVFTANPSIVWNADEILSMARLPTAGDDYVFGTAANDVLHGLDGYDFIDGGDGDDVIYGDDKGDTLLGGAGNDVLWTGAGTEDSHTLNGGSGNDRLMIEASATALGGAGSDTYVIENRQVRVTIDDRDTAASSIDVLQFGAGISLEDLRISVAGSVLQIQVRDRSQPAHFVLGTIDVWNFFRASARDQVIDEIRFADSPQTVLTFNDVLARTLIGDDTNEVITGFETADVLRGNGGNDILNGLDGADDLDGGAGHDQLNGGLGDDVYRVGGDVSPVDEIFDTGGADRLEFAAGVQPANVLLYRVSSGGQVGITLGSLADALLVVYGTGTQNLLIENFFAADDSARVEEFRFADGTVWDSATIAANTIDATGIADTQAGTAGNDSFAVDHSSDLITEAAGAGVDSVNASVSYVLPTNVENLTLTGALNLQGTGNELDNTIIGNSGANRLVGGGGVDTMSGGAGDDMYWVGQSGGESFDSTYNNFQDIVVEQQDGGIDTIMAVTYSAVLPEYVERFVLIETYRNASNFPNNAYFTQQITGNGLDNFIDASAATPYFDAQVRIDGGAGADVMIGNYSRNVYVIDNVGDVIVDTGGNDTVESYMDYVLRDDIEHLTLLGSVAISATGNAMNNVLTGNTSGNVLAGGAGSDQLFGMEGGDTLLGGEGNDILNGGLGADTMRGGEGDDRYVVDSSADVIVEEVGGGVDRVSSSVDYTLADGLEYLSLTGAAYRGVGNALDNVIVGNSGYNTLVGGTGNDSLEGYLGGDSYEEITATSGHDRIYDTGGSDTISLAHEFKIDVEDVDFVRVGNDLRIGFSANSSVTVSSWFSNSTYQIETLWLHSNTDDYFRYSATQINGLINGVNTGPVANWSTDAHIITLGGTTQFQLAADMFYDIESQRSLSYSVSLSDGSPLPAWIIFDAQTNSFSCTPSGAQADASFQVRVTATDEGGLSAQNSFYIHVRRPTIVGTAGDDHMFGSDVPEMMYGGAGNDTIGGGDGADEIDGEDGNDVLDGGLGADYIHGGAGNDALDGGAGNDALYGDGGEDVLDGGSGADIIEGGAGNDIYYVDDAGDRVTEFAASGIDEVRSTVSYTLTADVENLTLLGGAAISAIGNSLDNVLLGNSAANQLTGGSGHDTLDGGLANDAMSGGQGNDIYYVDDALDTTTESSGQGTDTVRATLDWTLATNVENLELLGSDNLSGKGNGSVNRITGNAGDNTLNGLGGADTLIGGAGNDTYVVDNAGDVVTEFANDGIDLVQSTVTYTLSNHVENLTLGTSTSTANINGFGNALDNVLTGTGGINRLEGGDGNDTLDGLGGNDTMLGGQGNDTYVVAQSNDVVTESANQGTDTVRASVSYTLTEEVENLVLMTSAAINGSGNTLANVMTGNAGNNTLTGNGGDDLLIGGNGADIYSYSSGHGADTIDNASSDAAQDRLNFTNVTRSQVSFTRSNNDLLISRNGSTTDSVRVSNWFGAAGTQLDFVQFTDQTLTSAQINALFGSSALSSIATAEEPVVVGDEWDRSLLQFIDAINHFGGQPPMVVDQVDSARDDLSQQWLVVGAIEHVHREHRGLSIAAR